MEVWDPKDKPTVFSRIKKAIEARERGLKVTRYIIYPGILFILVLLVFSIFPGCTTMKWPWKKDIEVIGKGEDTIIITDLAPREFICTKIDCGNENIDQLVEEERKKNIIACIKLLPECKNE